MLKTFVSTCILAGFVCGLSAYTLDHRTRFTFSGPVAIPGVTLPAGTYTFRLVDPATGGKVVQVLNDSGTQSYGMFLSMAALRPDMPEKPEISFMETGTGVPAAVKTWWQEGSRFGYEFIYSKEQALKLARGVMPPAPAAEARPTTAARAEIADETAAPVAPAEPREEERVAALGEEPTVQQPAQAANQQAQGAQSAPVTAQESSPAPADQGAREELPRTASFIPLAMMLGTAMVFGGMWLRRRAKA